MKSITMMVMTICRVAGCVNRQSQRQMPQSPCTVAPFALMVVVTLRTLMRRRRNRGVEMKFVNMQAGREEIRLH